MNENFRILQSIIENGGREGYITDDRFNIIWSNSKTPLVELLMSANRSGMIQPKERETSVACADGSALKITPLIIDGKNVGYLFERFPANQLVELLSKTEVFKRFSKEYNGFRESTFELFTYLTAETEYDEKKADEINALYSGSINKTKLLGILNCSDEPRIIDLYIPVSYVCGLIQAASRGRGIEISVDLEPGLFVEINRPALEYVLMNLMLNAFSYCSAPKKKIQVKMFRENDSVILKISDNGKNCDLERIEKFRTIFGGDRSNGGREGLGIAIAQVFADKYNCGLSFENSKSGGLCVTMRFRYQIPDGRISLFSPSSEHDDFELLTLMRKCFAEEDLIPIKSRMKH